MEIEKEVSPMQPMSNPRESDIVQQTNGNFMGKDSRRDPADKMEGLESQSKAQIFQGEDSQSREVGLLGCGTEQATIDEQIKGVKEGKSKTTNGSGVLGKIGIGPDPLGEVKKGQWTRITNRPNPEPREEVMHGAEGLKCKAREIQGSEEFNVEKEKKQKTEEETKKLSVLFATHLRSVEVVEQPCRGQRVFYVGTVRGLGTDRQFKSSATWFKHKIPQ